MNIAHQKYPYSFSAEVKTVNSWDFFEDAISICEYLMANCAISDTDKKRTMQYMIHFSDSLRIIKERASQMWNWSTVLDASRWNDMYRYLYDLRQNSPHKKLSLVKPLPDNTLQVSTTQNRTNTFVFPPRWPYLYMESKPQNIVSDADEKVIPIDKKWRGPPERIDTILNSIFTSHWSILPEVAIANFRKKTAKVLSKYDPVVETLYETDCLVAERKTWPNIDLSKSMYRRVIEFAIRSKDWELIQILKNQIKKEAANDEEFYPNCFQSSILSDHISYISPSHPIVLDTLEFPVFDIISIKTINLGREAHYIAQVLLENGNKKTFLMRADCCRVWEFACPIIGTIDADWLLTKENIPCTIMKIRTTVPPKTPAIPTLKDRASNFLKKWLNRIKNMFDFGKNTQEKVAVPISSNS